MLALPERRPCAADQVLRVLKFEGHGTGGIQIDDAPIEIEELDAVAAAFNQVPPELLERWEFHGY